MGYNSQSNIMKKLLLLGIATLVALCTACEKDKDEPKDSNGNSYDPNKEYCWKGVFKYKDGSTEIDYMYGTYDEASSAAQAVLNYYYNITGYTMTKAGDSYCD